MTVKLEGAQRLKRKLNKIPDALAVPVAQVVRDYAERIERTAKRNAPVRTGKLRDSIETRLDADGRGASVVAGAPHAHLLEFGTARAPAHPFLLPAAKQHKAGFAKDVTLAGRVRLKALARE